MPSPVGTVVMEVRLDTSQAENQLLRFANNASRSLGEAAKGAKQITASLDVEKVTRPLGRISSSFSEFNKSLEASNARVLAFGASVGVMYSFQRALKETVVSAVEVDKALKEVNILLNINAKAIKQFGSDLFTIARNTVSTFSDVSKAAIEFSRQGLNATETLRRTRDAMVLVQLTGMGVEDAVSDITAALNSFNETTITSTELISKLAKVDAQFAVSSTDLAEAIRRVGSTAQDAGISLDELLAMVTSVQQTTARGGAVIGNALKTIFTRLQRSSTLETLEQFGVAVRDLEGRMLPTTEVLRNLAKAYDTLGQAQRAQLAESVGGVYQMNVLKSLLSDLAKNHSIYESALRASNSAQDEAIARSEELNKTFSALVTRTLNNFKQLGALAGKYGFTEPFYNTIDLLNKTMESVTEADSETVGAKIGRGIMRGLGQFISGSGVVFATTGLMTIVKRFGVDLLEGFKTLIGLNQQTIQMNQVEEQILRILRAQNVERTQAAVLQQQIVAAAQKELAMRETAKAAAPGALYALEKAGILFGMSQSGLQRIPKREAPRFGLDATFPGVTGAILRESKSVPLSSVRVGTHSALVTPTNPNGIGVFNVIDEPAGISQGVARSIKHGIPPALHGTSSVPNFADLSDAISDPIRRESFIRELQRLEMVVASATPATKDIEYLAASLAKRYGVSTKAVTNQLLLARRQSLGMRLERLSSLKEAGANIEVALPAMPQLKMSKRGPLPKGVTKAGIMEEFFAELAANLAYVHTLSGKEAQELARNIARKYGVSQKPIESYISAYRTQRLAEESATTKYSPQIAAAVYGPATNLIRPQQPKLLEPAYKGPRPLLPPWYQPLKPSNLSAGAAAFYSETFAAPTSSLGKGNFFGGGGVAPRFYGDYISMMYGASKMPYSAAPHAMAPGTLPTGLQPESAFLGYKLNDAIIKANAQKGYAQLIQTINQASKEADLIEAATRERGRKGYADLIRVINSASKVAQIQDDARKNTAAFLRKRASEAVELKRLVEKETQRISTPRGAFGSLRALLFGGRDLDRLEAAIARSGVHNIEYSVGGVAGQQKISQYVQGQAGRIEEARRQRLARIQNVSLIGGIAVPVIANTLGEFAGESPVGRAVASGIGRTASLSFGLGMFAPGAGHIFGAAVGGAFSAVEIVDAFINKLPKLAKAAEESSAYAARMQSNLQQITALTERLRMYSERSVGYTTKQYKSTLFQRQSLIENLGDAEASREMTEALNMGNYRKFNDIAVRLQERATNKAELDAAFRDAYSSIKYNSIDAIQKIENVLPTVRNVARFVGSRVGFQYPLPSATDIITALVPENTFGLKGGRLRASVATKFSNSFRRLLTAEDTSGNTLSELLASSGKNYELAELIKKMQLGKLNTVEPVIQLLKETGFKFSPEALENFTDVFEKLADDASTFGDRQVAATYALDIFVKEMMDLSQKAQKIAKEPPPPDYTKVNLQQLPLIEYGIMRPNVITYRAQANERLIRAISERSRANIEVQRRQAFTDISGAFLNQEDIRNEQMTTAIIQNNANSYVKRLEALGAMESAINEAGNTLSGKFFDILSKAGADRGLFEKPEVFKADVGRVMQSLFSGVTPDNIAETAALYIDAAEKVSKSVEGLNTPKFQELYNFAKKYSLTASEDLTKFSELFIEINKILLEASDNYETALKTIEVETAAFFNEMLAKEKAIRAATADFNRLTRNLVLNNMAGGITLAKQSFVDSGKILVEQLKTINDGELNSYIRDFMANVVKSSGPRRIGIEAASAAAIANRREQLTNEIEQRRSQFNIDRMRTLGQVSRTLAKSVQSELAGSQAPFLREQFGRIAADMPNLTRLVNAGDLEGAIERLKKFLDVSEDELAQAEFAKLAEAVQKMTSQLADTIESLKDQEDALNVDIEVMKKRADMNIRLLQKQAEYEAMLIKLQYDEAQKKLSRGQISGEEFRRFRSEYAGELVAEGQYNPIEAFKDFRSEFIFNNIDSLKMLKDTAIEAASTIKTSFADAFKSFAIEGRKASDVAREFALSIGKMLLGKAIDYGTNQLFNLFSPGASSLVRRHGGGVIPQRFAAGRYVVGGSGATDDVPALLTAGEFVVNKTATAKHRRLLEKLNSNADVVFVNEYQYDTSANPPEGRILVDPSLSAYALTDENNPQNKLRLEREENLLQYRLDYAEYLRNKEQAMRDFRRGKMQALIGAYLNAGFTVGAGYLAPRLASTRSVGITPKSESIGGSLATYDIRTQRPLTDYRGIPYVSALRRAAGGYVTPYSTDTVPAVLTKGEYVASKTAVDHYGKDIFDRLNKLQVVTSPAQQSPTAMPNGVRANETAITTQQSIYNNVSINITNTSAETNTTVTSKTSSAAQVDVENIKKLSLLIKEETMRVISEQQRPGGLLYKSGGPVRY